MKLIYLNSTKPDLAWYRIYYGSVFPAGAKRASAQYLRAIANLTDNPHIGQPVTDDGLRRYVIPRIPFSIFYRVTDEHIEIVHIWDQRSDPAKLGLQEEAVTLA
jgi:plasmid stabilization system protein ParE